MQTPSSLSQLSHAEKDGLISTDDDELHHILLSLRAHGWTRNLPSIKPLSAQQLAEISHRVDCIVTLEEHSIMGGLGACVAEEVAGHRPLPICRIGIEDRFSAYCGTWDYLLQEHRLDLPSVKLRVSSFLTLLQDRRA